MGNKKADPIDIITDDIVVKDSGIVQHRKTGQFVKGTPNPRTAARAVKVKKLKDIIERKTGPDCERIIQKLAEIALYDPDMPEVVRIEDTGEYKTRKRKHHYVNINAQLQAITLLLHYVYGRPTERKEVDKQVNVNIEKKVADITQLINQNRGRLKRIK